MTKYDIWDLLKAHDVVKGELPIEYKITTPWYIKALQAFGSWLGSIFIFSAFFLMFEDFISNFSTAMTISFLLFAMAFYCFKKIEGQFAKSLGLAASIAGQLLFAYAIFGLEQTHALPMPLKLISLVIVQIILLIFMPNFIHGVLSTTAASIAFSYFLQETELPNIAGAGVMLLASIYWRNEFLLPKHMKKMQAMGYGLILAMVFFAQTNFFDTNHVLISAKQPISEISINQWSWLEWLRLLKIDLNDILAVAVILYTVAAILKYYQKPYKSREGLTILSLTLLVCAVGFKIQGFHIGIFLLCLGFFAAHHFLSVAAIIILLSSISLYYYNLQMTLLDKSISLCLTGIVLLTLRRVLFK